MGYISFDVTYITFSHAFSGFDSSSAMSLRCVVRGFRTPIQCVVQATVSSTSRGYAAIAAARSVLEGELESIRSGGTWKGERIITSKQGSHISVDGSSGGEYRYILASYTPLFAS